MLDELDVTVICVVSSYGGQLEKSIRCRSIFFEKLDGGVKLIRVRVPEFTKLNKISRVKNTMTYFFRVLGASRKAGKQDYIFTISQPSIIGGVLVVLGK